MDEESEVRFLDKTRGGGGGKGNEEWLMRMRPGAMESDQQGLKL